MSLKQTKVARLLKYLQFRDYKSKLLKTIEDEDSQPETGTYTVTSVRGPYIRLIWTEALFFNFIYSTAMSSLGSTGVPGSNQRRQRLAHDFLVWMDQTGDLLSLAERQEIDPIKQERIEVSVTRSVYSELFIMGKIHLWQWLCDLWWLWSILNV